MSSNNGKVEPAKKTPSHNEVTEKATRRKFKASYKARILKEFDSAASGERAAILRREGLYTSHIATWRQQRSQQELVDKKRGPKANPLTAENQKLKAENLRLQKRLGQATAIIELQKKVADIIGITLEKTEQP
jgi:transposase-like protein